MPNYRTGYVSVTLIALLTMGLSKHKISIEDHTDHRPIVSSLSQQYSSHWELSGARASYAIRHLINNGLSDLQFQAVGYGSTRPIDKDHTTEGHATESHVTKCDIP